MLLIIIISHVNDCSDRRELSLIFPLLTHSPKPIPSPATPTAPATTSSIFIIIIALLHVRPEFLSQNLNQKNHQFIPFLLVRR
eukprot:COSAG02_NODE_4108_length_5768_cov_66.257717_7_plen_83_part_00